MRCGTLAWRGWIAYGFLPRWLFHHVDSQLCGFLLGEGGGEAGGGRWKKSKTLDLLEGHGRVYFKSKFSHEHLPLPLIHSLPPASTESGTYKQ